MGTKTKLTSLALALLFATRLTTSPIAHAKKPSGTSGNVWVPSFRADVLPVLVQNCATAEGCHGAHGTESVKLDLRERNAYAQLVDAPAVVRKGSLRVRRGKSDESFLVDKLVGSLAPGEGKRMPLDEQTGMPLIPSPLPVDYVERVLKPWIAANAPDN